MSQSAFEKYQEVWKRKSKKQIEKEIISLRKYMQKYSQAYAWHGSDMTPPGSLSDGDKLTALRELVEGSDE